MIILYAILLIVAIIGIIGIIYIYNFNNLQDRLTRINEAESIIDDCLRNKYDTILKIENIIHNNITETKIVFKELEKLKKEKISTFEMERKLNDTLILMDKVKNDYPDLLDTKECKDLYKKLLENDEKISAAKKYYNKYTSSLNILVNKFPSNIISKLHGVKARNYFDNKDMADDDLEDFKL